MARAAAPIFSGFRVATSTTRRLSRSSAILLKPVLLKPVQDLRSETFVQDHSKAIIPRGSRPPPLPGSPCDFRPCRASNRQSDSARIESPLGGDHMVHLGELPPG